jgi:hypothetical protein
MKPSFESALILLPKIYRSFEGLDQNKNEWENLINKYVPDKK